MIRAAGILIVSKQNNALYLKRGNGGDFPNCWCFPGGRLEGDEDALQAAIRETLEECGYRAKPKDMGYLTRRVATSPAPAAAPAIATDPISLGEAIHNAATAVAPELASAHEVDFTTFVITGVEEFTPILNDEHTGYAWAPVKDPPQPLHPGCSIALRKAAGMNELEVAQAIRDGELSSPQPFGKFHLFAIRITGTEYAYRNRKLGKAATKDDIKRGAKVDALSGKLIDREAEYVYRDPAFYLNDEFLARCNGLPVVLEHPVGNEITSDEFNDRAIGMVFLPYIVGSEVWAIAKIYDAKAIIMMQSTQLSTSPGVVWHEAAIGAVSEVDGHKFLIEGKPHLLDHIAICWQGVWDKGGEAAGVNITRGDSDMTAEELQKRLDEEKLTRDARDKTIDGILAGLSTSMTAVGDSVARLVARKDEDEKKEEDKKRADARGRADSFKFGARKDGESDEDYGSRMDAEEKALCDAFEEAGEDKEKAEKAAKDARKDSEDEEKKRADAVRMDSTNATATAALGLGKDILKQLDDLKSAVAKSTAVPDADIASFGRVQHRADSVYSAMGGNAPRPAPGESLLDYRKRIVVDLKPHSTRWAKAEISVAAVDEALFGAIEDQVLEDAFKAARDPAKVKPGRLQVVESRRDSGGKELTYIGQPLSWMRQFMPPLQAGSFEGAKPGSNR